MDWSRIVVPQPDGYDLEAIATLCNKSILNPELHEDQKVLFRCFDDRVAVGHYHPECPYNGMDHSLPKKEVINQAIEYVKLWPGMEQQFPFFVSFINPIQSDFFKENPFGSSSGSHWNEPGLIYATANNAFPLAEAMVHEMAHLKLFSLGITMYEAKEWIRNPEEKIYYSAIMETERPMPAVFHAQYSFIHILHLDLLLLNHFPSHPDRPAWFQLTNDTFKRMEKGQEVLEKHLQPTNKGEALIDNFLEWSQSTIANCKVLLKSENQLA